MQYERRFTVASSPEQAIAFIADFNNLPCWDRSVVAVQQVQGEGAEVGAVYDIRLRFMGRALGMRYAIERLEPGRRVLLEGVAEGARAVDDIRAESDPAGALIIYRARIELEGALWRRLDPLLQRLFAPTVRRAVQGLRRCLGATP